MIDRLRNALQSLAGLSPEFQEEAATYIEALVEALQSDTTIDTSNKRFQRHEAVLTSWEDPFGAWSDLPDTMLDEA